ncbi:MAG: undecaprenyl-phosphate galactose phosphotransferase WbaP [Elusimicrobiales bacterium]|jgi:undecaprenyl-phosphate galactose phosphotransferase
MFQLTKIKNRLGIAALFLGDILCLLLIFQLSVILRKSLLPVIFHDLPLFLNDLSIYSWIFPIWLGIMTYEGAYSRRFAVWDEVKFLWKSSFFACVAVFTILFISKKGPEFSRTLMLIMGALSVLLFPFLRAALKKVIYSAGLMKRKMLIVGSGEAAVSAFNAVRNEPNLGYDVAGFVDDSSAHEELCGLKVHPQLDQIERYINSAGIHDVIVAKPELDKDALSHLINAIQHKAENTLYIPDFKGLAVSGTELRYFFREQAMIIEIRNNLSNPLNYAVKRSIDYLAGLLLFLLSLPLLALIAHLIRRDSPGPAFLLQRRIGRNGRPFRCYKFRTMYLDAEERLHAILKEDAKAKAEWDKFWKLKNDPRITKAGQWLRATSLDELPQVINILKGEMSLIGPRPYLPREKEFLVDEGETILKLPPGITGLWQISGRSDTSYDFRITMDSWYVKNWDLWLDVMIIFKTIGVVLKKEGAR